MAKDFVVTPWEVSGEVDYDRLIKEFGVERITNSLKEKIRRAAGGELHPFIERGLFFSHRDMNWLLKEYGKGNKFFLYTGRGPSGNTHIGHIIPWLLTKWFQDRFNAKLYFQFTNDEKFLVNKKLSVDDVNNFVYENALDVVAVGFDPKKTVFINNFRNIKELYVHACRVAKKVTFSTAKAVFGFTNETNIGHVFFRSVQVVPAFLESEYEGRNVPCLIPHGIDQDPYFRVARDVLPKLGYYKPASIQSKFLNGLGGKGKMSASIPQSTIYTTDSPKDVSRKVWNTLTGGRETVAQQRKMGGNPDRCVVFEYLNYLFESDVKALEERRRRCVSGEVLCGECKHFLAEKINLFLKKHQAAREKAKRKVDKFWLKE